MSWSFSLALVEEFKQQGCLVTPSYARLSEIRTADKSSWLARKTGQSRPSQSGTTHEPLTVSLGVAPLMSCLVGSRVSPSAKQGNKKQSTTTETSGQIPSESFARYDRESSSWRMSPDLFGSTCPVSWETWPKQGTIQNGVCWEREMSEPSMRGNDCGSMRWPTPTARDHKDGTKESCQNVPVNCLLGRAVHVDSASTTGSLNPLWVEWLMGWPIGWTGLEPLGTGKYRSATPQPGDC